MNLLEFQDLRVAFPGVLALAGVSFGVRAGSVHALMGENGAGKSTLLKTLSGVNRPERGGIVLDGQALTLGSTRAALDQGVAVIYQELHLVPQLSVAENLLLGQWPARLGCLDRKRLRELAAEQLAELGEAFDPDRKVAELSIAQRQVVEIGKALMRNARVIAMDEPTSSLSAREVEQLMRVIEKLRSQGRAVLYVSHRMEEIYRICDAVTVLRDGRHVSTHADIREATPEGLIRDMVGRPIADIYHYRPRAAGDTVLEVEGLEGPGLSAPASLKVRKGEIVGLFGLIGAGRSELVKLLYGATRAKAGKVRWRGRTVRFRSPRDAIAAGWGLCPEDRKAEGIVPLASVADNLNLSCRRRFSRLGLFINRQRERRLAQRYIGALAVKTRNADTPIGTLSGGNQQKVILARWLAEHCALFLMDEPTRGIDIGARAEIYDILYRVAEVGHSVLLVSSDIAEVAGVCDRVLVMREGALVADLPREAATAPELLRLALPASA